MATTPEHERIIDIFDQIITFSYAYEWQKLQNNAIDELFKLRDGISSHVERESLYLFMSPTEKKDSVISILNKLSDAVQNDSCPKVIDFEDVWLNKPENLGCWYINEKQEEEFDEIAVLVNYVICSLNRSLPNEIKPFVSFEQVDALFKKSYEEISDRFTVPIHKDLLVSMIHQHFLKTFAIEQNTLEEVNSYRELVDSYCKKAVQRFVKMVQENFIDKAVINFFDQAKGIGLEIDRYYSWALICYGPITYEELLSWYSYVNAHELVKDSHYQDNKNLNKADLDLKLKKILNKEIGYVLYPSAPKGGIKRYMFDSNRTPVLIDGKTLQNHLVMSFPYDKPLSDLQDKLRNYARYIGNLVNSYGHTYGHTVGFEDEVKSATAYRLMETPYKRLSLSNVGGVLQHICSLLFLQYERSNDDSAKKIDYQKAFTLNLINDHGFSYGESSVNTARNSRKTVMLKVVNRFRKPQ